MQQSEQGPGPYFTADLPGIGGRLKDHPGDFVVEEIPAYDPTGAGDTFAGGFIGHLVRTKDISFENIKTAIIVGSAMASFCVEKFGAARLKEVSSEDISRRIAQFVDLVNFDIELA